MCADTVFASLMDTSRALHTPCEIQAAAIAASFELWVIMSAVVSVGVMVMVGVVGVTLVVEVVVAM